MSDSEKQRLPSFPVEDVKSLESGNAEVPDRWRDRFRHAWLLYVFVAVGFAIWATLIGFALASKTPWIVVFVIPLPLLPYLWTLEWRLISGRDVNTGERQRPGER